MTTILPNLPVSPLRQKLIDDMTMRHFSVATQRNYIRDVGRFASFLRRPPDTATTEDVRQFQLAQSEAGVPVPTMNTMVSALRFFFANTLDRPDLARKLVRVSRPRNLPVVLSRDEVVRLLNATTTLKHQAALSVAYGAGLRVGEVAMLKVRDIDSERMLIRVERGKGGRYRNAMLSPDLLIGQHQSLGRIDGRRCDGFSVNQTVQQVQHVGLGGDARCQCHLDGQEYGILVVLQHQRQDLHHLAVTAWLLEQVLLQRPEGIR